MFQSTLFGLIIVTDIHKREPLVLIGLLSSILVLIAGHFGIVLDHSSVQSVLEPTIISLLARPFVKPAFRKDVKKAEELAEKVHPKD